MDQFIPVDHPLLRHKLAIMRDRRTKTREFNQLIKEAGMLMTFAVMEGFPTHETTVEPAFGGTATVEKLGSSVEDDKKPIIIPIVRNGLVMAEAITDVTGSAKKGHIGIYRDPSTGEAFEYLISLPPDPSKRKFIIVDPLVATGNTASRAIKLVYENCADYSRIYFVSLIITKTAMETIRRDHKGNYQFFYAAIDSYDEATMRVIPGFGNIAERLFGK